MKLIASDFDGTLSRGGKISDADREALRRWREYGNLFGIVTGRGGEFAEYAANRLDLGLDFVICGSGSMIYDGSAKLLETHETPAVYADMLEAEAKGMDATGWGRCTGSDEGCFCQFSTRFADCERTEKYVRHVNETIPQITAFQNGICVDVVGRGISKATGIARIALIYGVSENDVTAVGDSYNDLPMIAAYNGYAIEGSAIESSAPHTCRSIAEVCERFGAL